MAQEEEEEEEDDSDASSYDDFSSSGSDDDEEKQRRKEERQKRKAARAMEWGPVWNPPKQPPPLPPKEEKARRVFVGNVPPGLTEEAVRKCFGDFGAIDAVEIHSDHAFVCVCNSLYPFLLDPEASESGSATRLYAEDSGGRSCTRKAMHNLAGSDVRVELAYGEEMRVHRSLFNPKDDGKWRFAPYGERGGAIVDARPVSVRRPLPACHLLRSSDLVLLESDRPRWLCRSHR